MYIIIIKLLIFIIYHQLFQIFFLNFFKKIKFKKKIQNEDIENNLI